MMWKDANDFRLQVTCVFGATMNSDTPYTKIGLIEQKFASTKYFLKTKSQMDSFKQFSVLQGVLWLLSFLTPPFLPYVDGLDCPFMW